MQHPEKEKEETLRGRRSIRAKERYMSKPVWRHIAVNFPMLKA
jgi:hypothetical protein